MRRHIVTKNSFYARLAAHGHEIVSDEDYAHLYSERQGRPSIQPSVMVRAMPQSDAIAGRGTMHPAILGRPKADRGIPTERASIKPRRIHQGCDDVAE